MVIALRALTDDEFNYLRKQAKKGNCAVEMRRAQIILAAAERRRVSDIATTFHYSNEHVRKMIKRFNEAGLAALTKAQRTGRPKHFTTAQREAILTIANTAPHTLGYDLTTWTLHTLKDAIIRSQLVETISIETIRQLLKSSNKHQLLS